MSSSYGYCAFCRTFSSLQDALCKECADALALEISVASRLPRCPSCLGFLLYEGAACPHRQNSVPILRLGFFRGTLGRLVSACERGGDGRVHALIAALIDRHLRREFSLDPARMLIVPVPCSVRSLRERGHDHMRRVAQVLASRHGYHTAHVLGRTPGSGQVRILRRVDGRSDQLLRVVVIDSSMHGGSTLSECVGLLEMAFSCPVCGLSVASH